MFAWLASLSIKYGGGGGGGARRVNLWFEDVFWDQNDHSTFRTWARWWWVFSLSLSSVLGDFFIQKSPLNFCLFAGIDLLFLESYLCHTVVADLICFLLFCFRQWFAILTRSFTLIRLLVYMIGLCLRPWCVAFSLIAFETNVSSSLSNMDGLPTFFPHLLLFKRVDFNSCSACL